MGISVGTMLPQDEIRTISSYAEVEHELTSLDSSSLVLWDIDGSLIAGPDMLTRGMNVPQDFKTQLEEQFPACRDFEYWLRVYSKLWVKAERMLIEPTVVTTIKQLQANGCTVLGFTAMFTSNNEVVGSLPAWRYSMLKNLGIEFSANHANHVFDQLAEQRGTYPVLHNGLIVTNMQPKGQALGAFLDKYGAGYNEVVFFDDELRYLLQVQEECARRKLPCRLFHYKGMENFPGVWNTERALKQIAILINEDCWISDQEMDQLNH